MRISDWSSDVCSSDLALVEHRDDLVKTRTQTINRLHTVLTHLIPGGASRDLNAERAAELLRTVRPRDTAGKTLRALAADLISELRGQIGSGSCRERVCQ